jgi:hypothetical protein
MNFFAKMLNMNKFIYKIDSEEIALKTIKNTSKGIIATAYVQLTFLLFFSFLAKPNYYLFFDPLFIYVSGKLIQAKQSILFSTVFFIYTIYITYVTAMNKLCSNGGSGSNVVLAIILLGMAFYALYATKSLLKFKSLKINWIDFIKSLLCFTIYFIFLLIVTIVFGVFFITDKYSNTIIDLYYILCFFIALFSSFVLVYYQKLPFSKRNILIKT